MSLNFSGHIHLQHISEIDGVTDIATSAMCVYPCHYGILTLTPEDSNPEKADADPAADGIIEKTVNDDPIDSSSLWNYTYEAREIDMAAHAQRLGSEDPVLLDFKEYCRSIFTRTGLRNLEAEFASLSASDEDKEKMADGISRLNLAYFSGRLDTFEELDELLGLWQKNAPQSLYIVYLLSLKDEKPADMTALSGTL